MRTTKLTADEIYAAEKAASDRRDSRNRGFAKMSERDQSVQVLSNGVTMLWHVNKELRKQEGEVIIGGVPVEVTTYRGLDIPEDSFALKIDGKIHMFNLEEFRRWLRWG